MANERTTMSVPEMQRMLGIKKTDAYWLVHKNVFETIIVEKKMRVVIESFEKWYANHVLRVFPDMKENNKTVLILKKPKTTSSIRKVFLPRTVAEMLVKWKLNQDFTKESVGKEYIDYNLVVANSLGTPIEHSRITSLFKELIETHDLPKVVFHSLRHSSITYKLKLNGGDVKSVQGDSSHAVASMVTDQYSHILDDDRKSNAARLEEAFYSGKDLNPDVQRNTPDAESADPSDASDAPGINQELLLKILANPEMANLLTALAKSLK